MNDTPIQPPPLRLSRIFPAPRALVFAAWSAEEHVRRWFCPAGYTVPEARVEMRLGGRFDVTMRRPDGTESHARGIVTALRPAKHLAIGLAVADDAGHALFHADTEVTFTDAEGGTRLDIVQTYTVLDPVAVAMAEGAEIGWGQTLDRLVAELRRMSEAPAGGATQGAFRIERIYDVPPETLYAAWSDPAAKARWFGPPSDDCEELERRMDFRVGGTDRLAGRWKSGTVSRFDAIYHDIVPLRRIVYTYEMHLDAAKISISLATISFTAEGTGRTRLTVDEQAVFLDGYDDAGSRERGTGMLLDRLAAVLKD